MNERQPNLFPTRGRKGRSRPAGAGKLKAGERSLRWLRRQGYLAEVCEQFKPAFGRGQAAIFRGGYRRDLFGFADIIAFHPGSPGVLAVQTTSRARIAPHLAAYRRDPATLANLRAWLAHPGRRFVIHGWEPVEVPNRRTAGTRIRWVLTRRYVHLRDLA